MPRGGSTRSPSPIGSSNSGTKRRNREDDRHEKGRREDRHSKRPRSRTRSPHKRRRDGYRDDDRRRRHSRERDAYKEDGHRRSERRDSSWERRNARHNDDVRNQRRRSRERYGKHRRDGGDYRERKDRDHSVESRHRHRDRSRDRAREAPSSNGDQKASAASTLMEEEKKLERLAKLQAWKQKQAAEKDRKQKEIDSLASGRGLLAEMDMKAQAVSEQASPTVQESTVHITENNLEAQEPIAYAGKFDPKAIAKKAHATNAVSTKLGTDIAIPQAIIASASKKPAVNGTKADISVASTRSLPGSANTALKARGNISGFGIQGKAVHDNDKPSAKSGIDFDEEEHTKGSLAKLSSSALEDANAATFSEDVAMADASGEPEESEDDELQEAGTEEEVAAAARLAAEKRDERLQMQDQENGAIVDAQPPEENNGQTRDVTMGDTTQATTTNASEEEEMDPLDAFMSDLGNQRTGPSRKQPLKSSATKLSQPEAFLDDDGLDIQAVGADTDDLLNLASKKKKKELPKTNHAKITYESFRKSFYHEPSEMSEMTEEDVADLRLELDGIKIRGLEVPKPVQKWSQCGLGVKSLEVVQRLGFEKPSSIQSQAIPAIMAGRDVIGVAKTGSGKTIAFLLPMFRHIKDQRPLDSLEGPIGLVMTPTRELATQIHKDCKPFLKALNLNAVCAYGGAPIKDQIADLKRGAEIIICTPGRMIDLLAANSGRVTNLRRVTYIVLDEADRMFDMGFEPQVMKILGNIRPDKQTVLFSATFPKQMESLARKTLVKPIEIVVGGRSVVAPEITQIVEVREEETKFVRLLELLGELYDDEKNEDSRALIFVDRQESADGLLSDLMRKTYPCMSLHGGKDQVDRDSTINDFKSGVIPILIATSVAARGLDVKQLRLVVNYDAPNHLEDYVHRAGRTGRAGNTGTAVTFIKPEQDRYSLDIAKALRQSGQPVPDAVQELVNSFLEKVKSGKEKVSGSGFGGKGLERLDQERNAARTRERKTYKTGDEPDEEEKEEGEDKGDDLISKAASTVQSASAPLATPASAPTPVSLPGVPKGIDLDGKIIVHKSEVPATDNGKKGLGALDKVGLAAASIRDRLSKNKELRDGVPIDNKGPDAGAFHATLEINDFPQKARWAVTNRTNVAKILESTGTSITTKGSFYPANKEAPEDAEPKLYILVEGDTEVVVTNAMRELMRLLKEGTIAAADSDAKAPVSGRYNVL